jgi:nitrogen fixation/metabolism regulation signal transduction histidine kinase
VLLVRESLRSITMADVLAPGAASVRAQAPLFVYSGGALTAASDTLLEQLAPLGRLTAPGVHRLLVLGDEVLATQEERLGPAETLVGYRAVPGAPEPTVIAAPARTDDLALDRRRRDLGVLVLFATALGALAALVLSGLAARELARPIGVLREAALAIAAGQREPIPDVDPPGEFVPVFTAFRQMAGDLAQSRSALEEAQRRTEAVLRNVASGVVAVSPEGHVSLANPRAEALLACPLQPGTGLDCMAAPDMEARLEAFVREGSDEQEFEAELRGRQLRVRLTRLARGGAVLTLDDVTELAHAQRVLAWGEMARQVAHEIKNPLTPIRLGVQMLRRAHADRRPDFDRILDTNVGRILDEIDRLDEIARAFSKYGTAPAEQPRAEPTDVAAVVRDVVLLERMGEGSVDWRLEDADDGAPALAREAELREVLLNLLENARLAGARTVTTRVTRVDGRVQIAVADDGQGIAPDVLPRIFEPHFSTRTSGSGLGLAISRRMIEGWGGTIRAASTLGQGTAMTIDLAAANEGGA